jgi:hypothetical protein
LPFGLIVLAACDRDSPLSASRPDDVHPLAKSLSCQGQCAFIRDQRPFEAAVFRADSAGARIFLGQASLDGRRGDDVTLRLSADPAIFEDATIEHRIVAEVDGVPRAFTLREVAAGVRVYEFDVPRSITVRYWMTKQMRRVSPATSRARLIQHVVGARVTAVTTPWVRDAARSAMPAIW